MTEDEVVPVHLVAYADDAELDVDDSGEYPTVENHDEVEKYDTVYALQRESVEKWGLEKDIVTPDSPMWRDEFADLEAGDEFQLDQGEA